jgi:hypothetical protein
VIYQARVLWKMLYSLFTAPSPNPVVDVAMEQS